MPEQDRSESWTQVRAVLRVLFTVLGVLTGLWLLYALAGVIALVVLAVFSAYMLSPAVSLLQRMLPLRARSQSRVIAVLLVYCGLFGGGALAVYVLAPRFGLQLSELGHRAPGYLEAARERTQAIALAYRGVQLPASLRDALEAGTTRAVEVIGDGLREGATTVLGWLQFLPWLILIPVVAFFFLKDAETFQRYALHLLPAGRARWRGRDFIEEINRTLALYVRAQLIASLLVGVICGVGFAVLDVPYALLLGVVAGLLELVPLVGPLIVALLAGFLASTVSVGLMGFTLLFLAVLRAVQDYVVYPRLVASGTKLHPLAIILTLVCGSHLGGVAGLFLAIPAAAVLMVAHRHLLLQLGEDNLLAKLVTPDPTEEQALLRPHRVSPLGVAPGGAPELAGLSVAVVDNDVDARAAVVDLLEQAGAQVFSAGSVAEVLAWLEGHRPDVLLSDLAMPEQDGFDLIRAIRALPLDRGGGTKVAALSGYATEEDRARSLAAGFQAHLSKPVDPAELVATVRRLAAT